MAKVTRQKIAPVTSGERGALSNAGAHGKSPRTSVNKNKPHRLWQSLTTKYKAWHARCWKVRKDVIGKRPH